jgi:serine protease Do
MEIHFGGSVVVKKVRYFGFMVVLIALLAATGCSLPRLNINSSNTPASSTVPAVPPTPINPAFNPPSFGTDNVSSAVPDFAEIIAGVRPSVVSINTVMEGTNIFGGSFTQEGAGSGWVIDSSGLIVTNNHVVAGATSISVTLEDGRNFSAGTVRADSVSDLAVIKIDAQNLPPALKVGDSSKLMVGNWVIAIGNSLGEGISATKGIVSALNVSVSTDQGETLYDLIQTDAAINPGNSGGPLVNMAGEVIGINSIKVAQVGVEGMGYAISSKVAIPIINELITNGYVARPWMGVALYTVDQTAVRQLKLSVDKGVLLTQVVDGGPAFKAGLRQYDVITRIEGQDVVTRDDLVKAILSYQVGQTVQITYWRGNNQATTMITLGQAPASS